MANSPQSRPNAHHTSVTDLLIPGNYIGGTQVELALLGSPLSELNGTGGDVDIDSIQVELIEHISAVICIRINDGLRDANRAPVLFLLKTIGERLIAVLSQKLSSQNRLLKSRSPFQLVARHADKKGVKKTNAVVERTQTAVDTLRATLQTSFLIEHETPDAERNAHAVSIGGRNFIADINRLYDSLTEIDINPEYCTAEQVQAAHKRIVDLLNIFSEQAKDEPYAQQLSLLRKTVENPSLTTYDAPYGIKRYTSNGNPLPKPIIYKKKAYLLQDISNYYSIIIRNIEALISRAETITGPYVRKKMAAFLEEE